MKTLRHLFATSPLSVGARALVAASLLIGGAWISGCAGDAGSGDSRQVHGEGIKSLQMKGIALTPKQIDAIDKAHADNPHLSSREAQDVIGAADIALRSSGSDSSTGDCSWIDLWGNSDGHYRFNQAVFPDVGEAATGDISISTDGWFAATADHDLTLAGDYQHFEGTLAWTGVDAAATTMDGWMVTTGGNFCTGALHAEWE